MAFPESMRRVFEKRRVLTKDIQLLQAGDESLLQTDLDFVGLQNYTREVVRHSTLLPYLNDSTTQRCIIKSSGFWFQQFLQKEHRLLKAV